MPRHREEHRHPRGCLGGEWAKFFCFGGNSHPANFLVGYLGAGKAATHIVFWAGYPADVQADIRVDVPAQELSPRRSKDIHDLKGSQQNIYAGELRADFSFSKIPGFLLRHRGGARKVCEEKVCVQFLCPKSLSFHTVEGQFLSRTRRGFEKRREFLCALIAP